MIPSIPNSKTLAQATLCRAYKYSGTLALYEALARLAGRRSMTILVFHRVTDLVPEGSLTVGLRRFRRICRLLSRRFRVVPLGEVFRVVRSGQDMPARTVAVTFDDCYYDNLDAARVLAEFGLPATFFVPTGYVGTDHVFDWDRGLPRMPNLSWDDVRTMARMGFEIGSHTVSHANLGAIGLDEARRELAESRAVLQNEIGQAVRWFAYPFGGRQHQRPECVPLIREAGYEGAVSACGGMVRPGIDPEVLPREAVPDFRSVTHLEVFLRGGLSWLYGLKGVRPFELPPAISGQPCGRA